MLEDEQKKIITYHRIWFVRLIAMIVACQALKQLIGASPLWREEYPFGLAFYTKYARLCNLDDFVKVYGANFWLGLKVLFTCALVCYVLAWIMQKVNEKTSARLDLFADVTVIAVLIVDFISNLYCFKAHVYAEQSTVLYFVRIAVMIIVLLIHIYEYRRNKNLFDKETKAVHISSLVVGIAFVCVSAFFVGKNFVIYNNYKSFYGAYSKEEHGPDALDRTKGKAYQKLKEFGYPAFVSDTIDKALMIKYTERIQTVSTFLKCLGLADDQNIPKDQKAWLTKYVHKVPEPQPSATKRYIQILQVGKAEVKYDLPDNKGITIGRVAQFCDIVVEGDPHISKKHCEVIYDAKGRRFLVLDQSSNGLYINGQKLPHGQPVMIKPGQLIMLGSNSSGFKVGEKV